MLCRGSESLPYLHTSPSQIQTSTSPPPPPSYAVEAHSRENTSLKDKVQPYCHTRFTTEIVAYPIEFVSLISSDDGLVSANLDSAHMSSLG